MFADTAMGKKHWQSPCCSPIETVRHVAQLQADNFNKRLLNTMLLHPQNLMLNVFTAHAQRFGCAETSLKVRSLDTAAAIDFANHTKMTGAARGTHGHDDSLLHE
jgi:hypothetical protein